MYLTCKGICTFERMDLKSRLNYLRTRPLPGEEAQWKMAHISREKVKNQDLSNRNARQSAVMVLFCTDESGKHFIPLTQRFEYAGAHSNQISLPGGKFENSDSSLSQTAIRECREEIGVKHHIELIAPLSALYIPVSNFLVHPYVGIYNQQPPDLFPQASEVKRILKFYLDDLENDAMEKITLVEPMPGYKLKTPYFDVEGHIVWGATAMILSELKMALRNH